MPVEDFILGGDAPETGLAGRRALRLAFGIDLPGARAKGQVILAVVGDDQLLAKGVFAAIGVVGLALALPDAYEGEEPQQAIV